MSELAAKARVLSAVPDQVGETRRVRSRPNRALNRTLNRAGVARPEAVDARDKLGGGTRTSTGTATGAGRMRRGAGGPQVGAHGQDAYGQGTPRLHDPAGAGPAERARAAGGSPWWNYVDNADNGDKYHRPAGDPDSTPKENTNNPPAPSIRIANRPNRPASFAAAWIAGFVEVEQRLGGARSGRAGGRRDLPSRSRFNISTFSRGSTFIHNQDKRFVLY